MFFYENIRKIPFNNKVAIVLINSFIRIIRLFIIKKKNNNNVIILGLHRLGDSVFTIPAIKQIIDYHNNDIYLFCYPETVPIYKIVFSSLKYVELSHDDFFINNKIAKTEARKYLKKLNPAIIYDMTGNVTSASMLFRSSANEIIGINEPYYSSIYSSFKVLRKEPHLVDNYLDGIRSVIPIKSTQDIPNKKNKFNDYILIHPFASKQSKEWGLKNFIRLAESLNKKFKCILVTPPHSIPSDVKEVMDISQISLIETETTEKLVELIKSSSILIGNDSGAVHIANLLGIPTFTIYGPTNPAYHKPLSGINEYIIKEQSCSAKGNEKICYTFGGVYCPSNECMVNLNYFEVEKEVNLFLDKNLSKKFH